MESCSSWPDNLPSNRIKAIQLLTKGQVLINKLREMLYRPEKIESDINSVNGVVDQILGMFDNTISIISSSNDVRSVSSCDDMKSEDSSKSIKTVIPVKTKRGCYKRRKNGSTITKVTSTLIDDGYAWRKYGQKVILNSKHQRNYYRCSHKFEQGCKATKQVQKTNEEPSKYMITYNGLHTCNNLQKPPQIIVEAPHNNSTLISFEKKTLMELNNTSAPKDSFLSLGHLKQEQVTSFDPHTPWDPIAGLTQVQSESMSMVSPRLSCVDDMELSGVFSSYSTHCYEINNILQESGDFDDFLSELCS